MRHKIITGLGRSGSTWLGAFLSRYNTKTWFAGHELLVYNHNLKAWDSLKNGTFDRKSFWKSYYLEISKITAAGTVVDVDSFLRFFVPAPNAETALLIRNPIDVIRSFLSMNPPPYDMDSLLKPSPEYGKGFNPKFAGWKVRNWDRLNIFQKLCWAWVISNDYVYKHSQAVFRFGKLMTNWEDMKRLLEFVGLDHKGREQDWLESIKTRANPTKEKMMFPRWRDWPEQCKLDLFEICGPTMRKAGYWA